MIKGKNGKLIKRMMMLLEKDHENDWLKTSYTQGQGSLCFWIYITRIGSFWYAILRKYRHFHKHHTIDWLCQTAELDCVCMDLLVGTLFENISETNTTRHYLLISILLLVWERLVIEYKQFVSLTVPISISLPLFALPEKEYLESLSWTFHKDPIRLFRRMSDWSLL